MSYLDSIVLSENRLRREIPKLQETVESLKKQNEDLEHRLAELEKAHSVLYLLVTGTLKKEHIVDEHR